MSYFVLCTFDLLNNATSTDYNNAYNALERLGLRPSVTSDGGYKVILPNTTAVGVINGTSTLAVRDDMTDKIEAAFSAQGLTSKLFVFVGDDYAWGQRTT